jgi:hypothetical protein
MNYPLAPFSAGQNASYGRDGGVDVLPTNMPLPKGAIDFVQWDWPMTVLN